MLYCNHHIFSVSRNTEQTVVAFNDGLSFFDSLFYPSNGNSRPEPKDYRLIHLRATALDEENARVELPRNFPDFLPSQDEGGDKPP